MGYGLDTQHIGGCLLIAPHLEVGQCLRPEPDAQRLAADGRNRPELQFRPFIITGRNAENAARLFAKPPAMAAILEHRAFKPHGVVEQPRTDIHMIHQEDRHRPLRCVDDAVVEADFTAFTIDAPGAIKKRSPTIRQLYGNLYTRQRIGFVSVEGDDLCRMRGKGAMQRISAPIATVIDHHGMADMIRTAGKEEAFQRMVDPRIAIIGNGATGSDVDAIDDARPDIEDGGFIKENARRFARLKRMQDSLPVAVKTQKSRKRY
ncbi:hypothetical protein AT6N2_C3537 [Agrobacterium tumefaciens]|nr:hypothetical protein AT6N2_C3537 [Agrobacterium tumefaciens]